jgi:hypothetical protein
MNSDINYIFKEKIAIVTFVAIIVIVIFFITGQKNYLVTGAIFAVVNIIDYFFKKNRLIHLYDTYEDEQLKQLKYINWKK